MTELHGESRPPSVIDMTFWACSSDLSKHMAQFKQWKLYSCRMNTAYHLHNHLCQLIISEKVRNQRTRWLWMSNLYFVNRKPTSYLGKWQWLICSSLVVMHCVVDLAPNIDTTLCSSFKFKLMFHQHTEDVSSCKFTLFEWGTYKTNALSSDLREQRHLPYEKVSSNILAPHGFFQYVSCLQ